MADILENTFWTNIHKKKRPDGERKNGVKAEIRDLKKNGETPKHRQKQGYFREGRFSEKHGFQRQSRKTRPKRGIPNRPKGWATFCSPNACGSSCFAGGCLGRRERPNVEATVATRASPAQAQLPKPRDSIDERHAIAVDATGMCSPARVAGTIDISAGAPISLTVAERVSWHISIALGQHVGARIATEAQRHAPRGADNVVIHGHTRI